MAQTAQVTFSIERFDARPWPDQRLDDLFANAFPPFITADRVAQLYIERVRDWFADFYVMLVLDDEPVAAGWGVPIQWNGELEDLPSGYTDATRRAVECREANTVPDTFVICGAIVSPSHGRRGVAAHLITGLRDLAADNSLSKVIAPVRPTLKPKYPLTPIETFAEWTRSDGLPLDPWLRTHVRAGGQILTTAPRSQTMTATVAQWQDWSGLEFPTSGQYVIPDGLSPLHIDRSADLGTYTEPNIWVRHR
jgi:hypothetical protein